MGTFARNFDEINKDMSQECGGKASHLGELTNLKLNVPRGFCVVADAFSEHLKHNNLDEQIVEIIEDRKVFMRKRVSNQTKGIDSADLSCRVILKENKCDYWLS